MDEEQDELSSLDQYFEDLTAVEGESPLSALARDPREKLLIQQAEAAEQRRKKAFQAELDAIEAAQKRLLQQPTPQSKAQMLAGMVQKFREGRSDPNDPRFYEKRNLMSVLRDVGAYRRGRIEEEKKKNLALEEQQLKLDDLRRKYVLKEAEREAEAARGALEKYKPPTAGKQHPDVQRIVELTTLIKDPASSPEQIAVAQRQLDAIGRSSPGAKSRADQILMALEMMSSNDPAVKERGQKLYAALGGGGRGGLTLPQQRQDAEIIRAREFIKGFDQQRIDSAFRAGQYRNSQQTDIVNAYRLSKKPTYQEMLVLGQISAPMAEESEEGAIEEDMTDMPE